MTVEINCNPKNFGDLLTLLNQFQAILSLLPSTLDFTNPGTSSYKEHLFEVRKAVSSTIHQIFTDFEEGQITLE